MSQFYTDPSRETDEYALPDAEVFWAATGELNGCLEYLEEDETSLSGFYWQPCFPGCMPDGAPIGPFETEEEAIQDARGENE